jgi:hypothetical protein
MAIKKSFNGKTIRKPGAYSRSKVDNSAGAPLRATDVLFIVGESSKGAPGSVTGVQTFAAERLDSLVETYGEGPLVDCAIAAARPSRQSGIGGSSIIKIYKTNTSLQASAMLKKSIDNIYQVKDRAFGVEGNDFSVIVANGTTANQKSISVAQVGGTTETLGENAAQQVLNIRYIGDGTTAAMTIAGLTQATKTLNTTLAGDQTDGSVNLSIQLSNYTMKTLVDFINSQVGYQANLLTVSLAPTSAIQLDGVTATNIKPALVVQYRLQYEILDVLNASERIEAVIQNPVVVGLIDNATTFLSGGAKGASTNTSFSNAFAASFAEDYNVLLPAVSRDASEDIADAVAGFTDASSSYTISAVLVSAATHLALRGDTKNRKEAMGMGGVRKNTKAAAFASIAQIGSELMQLTMQDVLSIDAQGNERYMHPHVTAALAAGMRTGMPVGEPLTHKFPNVLDVGHFINPSTGLAAGDFNAGLDFDAAIDAGVLFMEKAQGGFRWVVDNTTYGVDDSFVFNRGSVVAASQFVARTIRETAELVFVGKKISNGAAASIKSVIRNKLRELNAPDVNIITASEDAPEGFREDTFTVTIQGNTARVQVEFKPVQGLDFIFLDFTLGDIRQSA